MFGPGQGGNRSHISQGNYKETSDGPPHFSNSKGPLALFAESEPLE